MEAIDIFFSEIETGNLGVVIPVENGERRGIAATGVHMKDGYIRSLAFSEIDEDRAKVAIMACDFVVRYLLEENEDFSPIHAT